MEKENIEAKDKEFRDKLKEMRTNMAHRQLQADQKESQPRSHVKLVVSILIVVVVTVYFVGKTMRSQPVPVNIVYKVKVEENKHEVTSPQTESDGTVVETQDKGDSHSTDSLIADSGNRDDLPQKIDPLNDTITDEESSGIDWESATGMEELFESSDVHSDAQSKPSVGWVSPYGTRISQNIVCSGVKARNCVLPQSVFALQENRNPHVWMEVYSDSVPYTLKHVYYFEGTKYVEVPLKIEYRRMRTWSYITLNDSPRVGSWHVETVAEDGTVLERIDFQVKSGR